MNTLEVIEKDLGEARNALANEKGREAEVYSRIVGYYRSVRNWNKGKREEYCERRPFNPAALENAELDEPGDEFAGSLSFSAKEPEANFQEQSEFQPESEVCENCRVPEMPYSSRTENAGLFDGGNARSAKSPRLLLFVQSGCPACPEAKAQAGEIAQSCSVKMETYQADTETGLAEAMKRGVVATPTVILLNSQGVELSRANSSAGIAKMKELLEKAA